MPAGTGREVKICVFSGEEFHEELKAKGADFIGNDQMLQDIGEGKIEFDRIIATPEQMGSLKKFARVLGPKGLMPNVKSGTLVKPDALLESVTQAKQGLLEFRVNEACYVMNAIGNKSFSDEDLERNLNAYL